MVRGLIAGQRSAEARVGAPTMSATKAGEVEDVAADQPVELLAVLAELAGQRRDVAAVPGEPIDQGRARRGRLSPDGRWLAVSNLERPFEYVVLPDRR